MGTRADFYVGRNSQAEWLGSIAYDGSPSGVAGHREGRARGDVRSCPILTAETEGQYREAVARELASREDATQPSDGWPWSWEDSRLTDYAYAFANGAVWASCSGHAWVRPTQEDPPWEGGKTAVFPDMSSQQQVTLGRRSGLLILHT